MLKICFLIVIRYLIIFSLALVPLLVPNSFGSVYDFDTNQSLFHKGDRLIVSGSVSYDAKNPFVTVQIFVPGKSNFADFNTVMANPDGSFTATFRAGGPMWTSDGIYPIKVTYDESLEKTIQYQEQVESDPIPDLTPEPEPAPSPSPESPSEPEPEPAPSPSPSPESTSEPEPEFETLKFTIPNFPALDRSPQHYIDRYNSESSYKSWFDSQFPNYSISDVVGYSQTHVPNFPALDRSPQHYIDRYNSESSYKSWFDSQFPNESIYNVLGYADPVPVPDWVRNNAEWWAIGEIDDSAFVTGIEFMIKNNIIVISGVPSSSASDGQIPNWLRNSAHWWSQGLISEDEFVESLKFLIHKGIVVIKQ